MARFATDVDLCPLCLKAVGGAIVILPEARRMAVRAHVVPVLRRYGAFGAVAVFGTVTGFGACAAVGATGGCAAVVAAAVVIDSV